MTTFGKLIVGALLIAVAVLAWVILQGQHGSWAPQPSTATTTQPSTIVDDRTYTNSQLSFSVMYPSIAASSTVDYSAFLPLTQAPLASFVLPHSMAEGTNLSQAGVYVGASSSPEAITSCGSALPDSGEISQGTETINGADFSVFTSSDAGAGNFYESKIYRRLENGWCVEVVELLHSTNIDNYTPGTVTEFDRPYFQKILEDIVHTYRSIPTGM